MVWSHYLQEITNNNTHEEDGNISEEDERMPPRNKPMDFDEWQTWYSNDLLNMWMSIRAYKEDSGNESYVLDQAEFNDFCEFCYNYSCRLPSKYPS